MTLYSGNRYRVENDSIVEELKTMLTVRELCDNEIDGNLLLTRDDGLKLLHMPCHTKCLYPDGTLIISSYDHGLITSVPPTEVTEKLVPILDEIWLSDAENSSNFIVDDVLERIKSDYFLCMKRTYQFEHKVYGRIQFGDENFSTEFCKMKFYNGSQFELKRNCENILLSMKNGKELRLNETELQFSDGKCGECCRYVMDLFLILFLLK